MTKLCGNKVRILIKVLIGSLFISVVNINNGMCQWEHLLVCLYIESRLIRVAIKAVISIAKHSKLTSFF